MHIFVAQFYIKNISYENDIYCGMESYIPGTWGMLTNWKHVQYLKDVNVYWFIQHHWIQEYSIVLYIT